MYGYRSWAKIDLVSFVSLKPFGMGWFLVSELLDNKLGLMIEYREKMFEISTVSGNFSIKMNDI